MFVKRTPEVVSWGIVDGERGVEQTRRHSGSGFDLSRRCDGSTGGRDDHKKIQGEVQALYHRERDVDIFPRGGIVIINDEGSKRKQDAGETRAYSINAGGYKWMRKNVTGARGSYA